MKKIILLTLFVSTVLMSCKKDRDCTCTITQTTVDNPTSANGNTTKTDVLTATQKITVKKLTKKQAQGACSKKSGTSTKNTTTTITGTGFNQTTNATGTETTTQDCELD